MTKEEAFIEINKTQDEYIDELISLINSPEYEMMKTIDFTSPTGTGKTKMMSKLINRFPSFYFIVTTLSKGQLHLQVKDNLLKDCNQENFYVYGSADYKINSKLQAENIIGNIPQNTKCIWLRDEGHIKTNRYDELLLNVCYKVINFSATNIRSDIQCNFTHTMMLRTVNQQNGTPEDAIKKLLEVKEAHKGISDYNPCAIFRCVGRNEELYNNIISLCKQYKLKFIDITDDPFVMAELCKDDNEYDVIINKFKIVEGIDIRRSHIIYMDNQPKNNSTTIQAIGRCRRNALLYRNDIDILDPNNKKLLEETRECFVYYNVEDMEIQTDIDGELQYAFCNYVSCESLKPNTIIEVINGQLPNGLYILELLNHTGKFEVIRDKNTGFNIVNPLTDFYNKKSVDVISDSYLYFKSFQPEKSSRYYYDWSSREYYYKVKIMNIDKFPIKNSFCDLNSQDYLIEECCKVLNIKALTSPENIDLYKKLGHKYTKEYLKDLFAKSNYFFLDDYFSKIPYETEYMKNEIDSYLKDKKSSSFGSFINNLKERYIDHHKLISIWSFSQSDQEKIERIFNEDLFITTLKYYCIKQKEKKLREDRIIIKTEMFLDFIFKNLQFLCEYDLDLGSETPNQNKLAELISNIFDNKYLDLVLSKEIEKFPLGYNSGIEIIASHREYEKDELVVKEENINDFFKDLDEWLSAQNDSVFYSFSELQSRICYLLNRECDRLIKGYVSRAKIDCFDLIEPVSKEEIELVKKKNFKRHFVNVSDFSKLKEKTNIRIANDKESAIIGVDTMRQIKDNNDDVIWVESKTVTTKIANNSKLNIFITKRYAKELDQAKLQLFNGKNDFNFDKKCNSILGYCVEYYSKYLLYGKEYLGDYIHEARIGTKTSNEDCITVRACMLKYKEMMIQSFGFGVSKTIKNITTNQLESKYLDFVKIVLELGKRTAEYVKSVLYPDGNVIYDLDPNLSIEHITGLADYITKDIILDVKVRNNIDEKCVRQVLAYHYLSTKRSDLHIKKVIVYDATSGKAVEIAISKENQIDNFIGAN